MNLEQEPNIKRCTTSKENKLLAEMFMKENVYFLMKFESRDITLADVDKVFASRGKDIINEFDAAITKQLIEGWRYVVNTHEAFSYELYLRINGLVAKEQALEWGVLRSGEVGVGGTEYKPSIPTEESILKLFKLEGNDLYKASMQRMVRLIKAQPFWDGNKRTAFLITNKFLIDNALGLVVVNTDNFDKFNELLNDYYNDSSKESTLVEFLINKCIYNSSTKKLIK